MNVAAPRPSASPPAAPPAPAARSAVVRLAHALLPFALGAALWAIPVPAGLSPSAWHLFALFAAAIVAVVSGAFPLLTAALLAGGAVVITGTLPPAKAYSAFANGSVLLVVTAFLLAKSVVKSGLGRRLALRAVARLGRSTLGLSYSVFLTDALIAPAFPSNTSRAGVLYPIVRSLAEAANSSPGDPASRRTGGYLMFSGMASLAVSSALWMTATSANPIGASIAANLGVKIDFGGWIVASCVPALAAILTLPVFLRWIFPPDAKGAEDAQRAAREELSTLGRLSRDERIVAVIFVLLVTGWVLGPKLKLDSTAVAFVGLGALLVTRVLTLEDLATEGSTLVMFLWLAILFAMSAQLNELGFMGYVGERLAQQLAGLSWPVTFVALATLYVLMHYLFVSQSAQVLALFGVFADVGIRGGVPAPLMAFTLLFASSYFSTITPQGGTQNIIFVGSGYLTQRELYRLGALTTLYCLAVFLALGTPWLLLVTR